MGLTVRQILVKRVRGLGFLMYLHATQGLQILLMSGVTVTSASQILESFRNIWSRVSQRKTPFSDFREHSPLMYTLSLWIHEETVAVR